jgi:glutamate-1-semialdehyde 2,1-aminomutase
VDQVAAVIMEPVMGNASVIAPRNDFLEIARALTHEYGALLIFDEVITGMRVAPGGAQQRYGVEADITVLSKALGAGFPISALGSSREIMECIVDGRLFHGGVYSGNTLVMAAADAALDKMLQEGPSIYRHLQEVSDQLAGGIYEIFTRLGIPHQVNHVGPMISLLLTRGDAEPVSEYREVRQLCDFDAYIRLQHQLQQTGVYYHPNQFEPMFLSTAHTRADIATVLERIEHGARNALATSASAV